MTINAKTVKTLPNGTHRLERGVYLRVQNEKRFWIFRYSIDKKRRDIGLGDVDTPIATVRAKAATLKQLVVRGIDPLERKAQHQAEQDERVKLAKKQSILFKDFYLPALEEIEKQRKWQSPKVLPRTVSQIVRYILPVLGNLPVYAVTPKDIVEALSTVWEMSIGEVILIRLKQIFIRAIGEGIREDNPAEWSKLEVFLPSRQSIRKGKEDKHHAAVSAEELRNVAKKLSQGNTAVKLCLLFGILTVCRGAEFCKAEWEEVSFTDRTLSIPPARRKDKKSYPFQVPLSNQAMRILERLPKKSKFVFQAKRQGVSVSTGGMIKCIRQQSDFPITVHGARSTFSDWCANNNKNFLVSEKCLMHNVGGAVFMAYQRDDLLEKRRELLQEWADYICPMEWLDSLPEIA